MHEDEASTVQRNTGVKSRHASQKVKDFLTFPLRAVLPFNSGADRWSLSSRESERFEYVAREVRGYCLDVGCGRNNRFVEEFLGGHGRGIDVHPYEGLTEENLVEDITNFPFADETFDSVTFIANICHVPRPLRDVELAEAYRCLKPGGNLILTMGNPLAEILVHRVVWVHGKLLGRGYDMDTERGMEEEEAEYLLDTEIVERMSRAGFRDIEKKHFLTQWGLNHLFVGWKE
jgi:SAM-dependent methyltransferase